MGRGVGTHIWLIIVVGRGTGGGLGKEGKVEGMGSEAVGTQKPSSFTRRT